MQNLIQNHWVTATKHGCGQSDCRQGDLSERIIARGNAAQIFLSIEHDIDSVATFVAPLVVGSGFAAGPHARNTGPNSFCDQSISESVGTHRSPDRPEASQPAASCPSTTFSEVTSHPTTAGILLEITCGERLILINFQPFSWYLCIARWGGKQCIVKIGAKRAVLKWA